MEPPLSVRGARRNAAASMTELHPRRKELMLPPQPPPPTSAVHWRRHVADRAPSGRSWGPLSRPRVRESYPPVVLKASINTGWLSQDATANVGLDPLCADTAAPIYIAASSDWLQTRTAWDAPNATTDARTMDCMMDIAVLHIRFGAHQRRKICGGTAVRIQRQGGESLLKFETPLSEGLTLRSLLLSRTTSVCCRRARCLPRQSLSRDEMR